MTTPQVTETELLMLAMLADGWTAARIGRRLGCSAHSAAVRLSNIYRKLGALNAPHAVAIAIRDGLINVGGPK